MIIGTARQAAQDKFRVDSHGAGAWIHPYFGTGAKATAQGKPPTRAPLPMLYLVEQDANTTIPTHFHQVSQFQVAISGRGKLGEHSLEPVTVHYTNAFTGYGPLQASQEGMSYFTVRNCFDPGLRPLPEAKEELMQARQTPQGNTPLNVVAQPVHLHQPILAHAVQSILAHEHGAAAQMHSCLAGSVLNIEPRAQERVWLLVGGDARLAQHHLQTMDGLFLAAQESLQLQVGTEGLQILELCFPTTQH